MRLWKSYRGIIQSCGIEGQSHTFVSLEIQDCQRKAQCYHIWRY